MSEKPSFFAELKQLAALAKYDTASSSDARSTGTGYELRPRIFAHFGEKTEAISEALAVPMDGIFGLPLTPAVLKVDPDFDSIRAIRGLRNSAESRHDE
jgi:hypothetical protein